MGGCSDQQLSRSLLSIHIDPPKFSNNLEKTAKVAHTYESPLNKKVIHGPTFNISPTTTPAKNNKTSKVSLQDDRDAKALVSFMAKINCLQTEKYHLDTSTKDRSVFPD